jgi:DNA replication and repair protein RecF
VRLERVEVWSVRNLDAVALDVSPGLNHLVGPNGAGKTALLEAIHVLFRGRSFRTPRLEHVIANGAEQAVVRAELDADGLRHTAGIARSRDARSDLRLDGVPCRTSDVASLLPLQLMLPDASNLVFGSPAIRRSFLDWGTFHVKRQHLEDLRAYRRALRHRNALLRSARGDERRLPEGLDAWTTQLLEYAGHADAQRREYVEGLRRQLTEVLARLAPELVVEMTYEPGWSERFSLEETLVETLPREVKLGATQSGPHRAELRLSVPQGRAADVLSRGQAKMLASALHLAQARKTRERAGSNSLFLIDDVGAELDEAHRQTFFQLLDDERCQVVTTGTAPLGPIVGFRAEVRTFHVERGECRQIDD